MLEMREIYMLWEGFPDFFSNDHFFRRNLIKLDVTLPEDCIIYPY